MRTYNSNSLEKCLINNKIKYKAFRSDIKESIVELFQNYIDHILLSTGNVYSTRCVNVIFETKPIRLCQ